MIHFIRFCLSLLAGITTLVSSSHTKGAEKSPNVLFIAIDDLRPELGCYGATHIHSPNIDSLAASGRLFKRAYCQQAVCNPSRTSLMTGMRPDSVGVTGNHTHFRTAHPSVVTLPQHFKRHGYHAAAIGKIYHGVFPDGASITKWDTMGDRQSWSVPAIRFGPRYYFTESGIASAKDYFNRVYKPKNPQENDWTKKLTFGLATESPDVSDSEMYDGKVADAAIRKLRELPKQDSPFFLAVGFIKPHSPYIAPKKYFDLYDKVPIAESQHLPRNAPAFAGHRSGELRRYSDQPNKGDFPNQNQVRVRHAYYACISFIDAQVGRVLSEIEQLGIDDNTIVCLFGDHGYHLGEHGLWGKTTNFELDTCVPLIIRAPSMTQPGVATNALVELVDLYPTLTELAGLAKPDHLEGTSLSPILKSPNATVKSAAMSQYPRGELMGYSLRTDKHRLTQWVNRSTGTVKETELYEYGGEQTEVENTAAQQPELVRELANRLVEEQPKILVAHQTQQPIPNDSIDNAATSFESHAAGKFETLQSSLGTWKAIVGTTQINDKYSTSGDKCLHLTGGKNNVLELILTDDVDTKGRLRFRAERWTKRTPFSFRIEKFSGDQWKEIYNGDQSLIVGRPFKSTVEIDLGDDQIKRLRFTVTSPENTGVLIDEFRIAPALPQQLVSVQSVPFALPALVGAESSALMKLKIVTHGSIDPISLTQVTANLSGSLPIDQIKSIGVFYDGENKTFPKSGVEFGKPIGPADQVVFNANQQLREGENFVWLYGKLKPTANIDATVGAICQSVQFSNGKTIDLQPVDVVQLLGVRVRDRGDDGVHTFRIPGMATTKRGTLIAVYDVRRRGGGDLPGDIDVGMSRSTDGGRSWEPMKIIIDMGDDAKFRYDGVGDPSVMVDSTTETIWVSGTWSHGNRSWVGSGPGLSPDETGQWILVKSTDDGVSWSDPINITRQVKKPEWCFVLQGPGKGITMKDGTLVFPAQYQDPPNPNSKAAHRLPHSAFIYSRDQGMTWQISTGAYDDTTEAQVIETTDGQIMINCRFNRESKRVVMTTDDMGKSWKEHPTNRKSLIEPRTCMASLINVGRELRAMGHTDGIADHNDLLLFSNPDSLRGRSHITIKVSRDGGNTWPEETQLLLDEQNGAGYSCLSMIDTETVGIIYEGSQAHMTFQRIKLADIFTPPKN